MKTEKNHYWQGEWIDDSKLEKKLEELPRWVESTVSKEFEIKAVLSALAALGKKLSDDSAAYLKLKNCLIESGELPSNEVDAALREIGSFLSLPNMEKKLKRELGSLNPFVPTRMDYHDSLFESWSSLGLLVHVSPQNSFAVGPMSVVEGLLSGNINFLKTGGSESLFPQLFIEALVDCDPSGMIRDRVAVARISSKKKAWLERIFSIADGIAAWGGEESIQSIRKMAPPSTRVIEWGHKISFSYVTPEFSNDESVLDKIAYDCCMLEQQACSSPQCVYLETSDWKELRKFGEQLARAFDRVSPKISKTVPGDAEAAEISMTTEVHRLHASFDSHAEVITAKDGSWRIYLDARPGLVASPLFRSIWLKPLPRAEIVETLRPMRQYLQTAGLACSIKDVHEVTKLFLASGIERIRRVGESLGGYSGEPHDGVYALQRYCRRVTIQLPKEATGISSYDEIFKLPTPQSIGLTKITSKENFSNVPQDETDARLYFKSGGSSGEPKLSTYNYDQYHEHMQLVADGIYAAGFDPTRDRAMNLFFAGGLYGGFISFFSALERLEAIQFPMAAHSDLEMVAKTIVKNRVNVLLGMPSYLLQLFQTSSEILGKYRGVEKIFYGGEHFSDAQKEFLKKNFGVRQIRSGAYGTVDIGPIGFQCQACEGGVHHLQQRLHYLEILKMDSDTPVKGDEVGRMIFTPRNPASNKPLRYEIGDVGHWVIDPDGICVCGRASPKFKLLGRMGDIFRIGSAFFNYQKFAQILSNEENYSGEFQIILEENKLKETIRFRISNQSKIAPAYCRETLLKHYSDLNETVNEDKTLLFEVEALDPEKFERTPGSGKLLRVIDRRSRS